MSGRIPPEAGNVHFGLIQDTEPMLPVPWRELMAVGAMFAFFLICALVLISMAMGYGWGRWLGWFAS